MPGRLIVCSMCALGAIAPVSGRSTDSATGAPTEEQITINDNRASAGTIAGGTLTIRLEARTGEWHPDGDRAPGIVVNAFSVEGGPLQIPGPLIRVPEGTEIRATVRNRLDEPLVVHGLYSRPGPANAPTMTIPAGETREVTFAAGAPGNYYYWAATAAETTLNQRLGQDALLSGAFIVDPRGGDPKADRVLVIGLWNNGTGQLGTATNVRIVINGRSWPHTERLNYQVGDTVRLRVLNAGAAVHPMHLHGFYFNVDSRGDERATTMSPSGSSDRLVVTERLDVGRTFSLTWKPTRPGNWLFHCHDNVHLQRGTPLDGSPAPAAHHVENHALEMMAGPVLGITVTGASAERAQSPSAKRRALAVVARVDSGGTDAEPAFSYVVKTRGAKPASPFLQDSTIVLKRGEPVSITVDNQLPEATAVHWHGIELESYYDGVAGFSGDGKRIAPPIPPGGSFEARFTPPRSGTFIYHTHIDEVRQQQAGLAGALLVLDAPETYDPEHDLVLMVTVPRKAADSRVVLLNGSSKPEARQLQAGQHYRLRFINVHTSRPSMRMRILRETDLLTWRSLAKDGMDLPADQMKEGPSEIQMGNGETYDFDFVAPAAGEIRLDVTAGNGTLLVTMPIHVVAGTRTVR